MKIDAYFQNVIVYDVFYQLDVVPNTDFALLFDEADGAEVFMNNDPVLDVKHKAGSVEIKTMEVGSCKVRIMKGTTISREILINVVTSVQLPAVSLSITSGTPELK